MNWAEKSSASSNKSAGQTARVVRKRHEPKSPDHNCFAGSDNKAARQARAAMAGNEFSSGWSWAFVGRGELCKSCDGVTGQTAGQTGQMPGQTGQSPLFEPDKPDRHLRMSGLSGRK